MIAILSRRDLVGRAQRLPLSEIELEHIARTSTIAEMSRLVVVFDHPDGQFKVLKNSVGLQNVVIGETLMSPLQSLIKVNLERDL